MRIFTNEEKLKAIELFIQYDFSPGAVITQIGYPSHRSVLYRWYKAYKANGNCFPEKLKRGRWIIWRFSTANPLTRYHKSERPVPSFQ